MHEPRATESDLAVPEPTELSVDDLDQVSGGLDLMISGSFFDQSEMSATQTGGCGCGGGSSSLTTSNTSSGTFQIVGLGFESMNEIFAVFAGLSRLFGR
ncbi:MAG: CTB family bacteriocin [Nodosilinea sp.]